MTEPKKPDYVTLWERMTEIDVFQFIYNPEEYDFDGVIGSGTDLRDGHWYNKKGSLNYEVPDLAIDTAMNVRILRIGIERWCMAQTPSAVFDLKFSRGRWCIKLDYGDSHISRNIWVGINGEHYTHHGALFALAMKLMKKDEARKELAGKEAE